MIDNLFKQNKGSCFTYKVGDKVDWTSRIKMIATGLTDVITFNNGWTLTRGPSENKEQYKYTLTDPKNNVVYNLDNNDTSFSENLQVTCPISGGKQFKKSKRIKRSQRSKKSKGKKRRT